MNLLRDLRASTRTLFLYEVTTSRHTRLRTIADRLGMTVQGASEYAHGLQRDGLLAFTSGEYRATKKGVEFLHDRLLELRGFVDRAGKAMAFVETTSAIAGGSTRHGSRVGLFMEDGLLVAYPGRASPSMGVAVHDASKGDLLAVRDLEGIVTLHPGRIVVARVRNGHGRLGPSKRIPRGRHPWIASGPGSPPSCRRHAAQKGGRPRARGSRDSGLWRSSPLARPRNASSYETIPSATPVSNRS